MTLKNVPTNVITGFLGSGKSTAILSLLAQKPQDETWAVLVNEFGEIGVDGGLIQHTSSSLKKVFVKEVPGGCMCCTNGLPMQIALTMLLARSKPQRLLIEPTGLGHPAEVLSVLASGAYEGVLDLCATIVLVDARKLSDERYTTHTIFNQQLEIADVVVASKADLYGAAEFNQLEQHLDSKGWLQHKTVQVSQDGHLPMELLASSAQSVSEPMQLGEPSATSEDIEPPGLPVEGYMRLSNRGEGFTSHGWRFNKSFEFTREAFAALLKEMAVERVKAIMRTDEGAFGYNIADNAFTEVSIKALEDSRVEIIADERFDPDDYEAKLLATLSA